MYAYTEKTLLVSKVNFHSYFYGAQRVANAHSLLFLEVRIVLTFVYVHWHFVYYNGLCSRRVSIFFTSKTIDRLVDVIYRQRHTIILSQTRIRSKTGRTPEKEKPLTKHFCYRSPNIACHEFGHTVYIHWCLDRYVSYVYDSNGFN